MPTDLDKLNANKESIISFIRRNGPSLPVSIARSIESSPLFASAFLSELGAERKVKMSNMKVGSSPLYYLPEQEHLLEKFIDHLNTREKEAFQKLKESKVLEDESLEPVIRVALRSIKDFAIPVKIRINENSKIFWKFFTISDQELKQTLQNQFSNNNQEIPKPKEEATPVSLQTPELKEESKGVDSSQQETKTKQKFESPIEKKQDQIELPKEKEIEETKKEEEEEPEEEQETSEEKEIEQKREAPQPKKIESNFTEKLKEHLESRNIEIISILSEKKKEITAKVRIETPIGKHSFFLLAKDKKKVNENDLTIAIQNAQTKKLSAIVASTGELDKKASAYLDDWHGLVKFEKIK